MIAAPRVVIAAYRGMAHLEGVVLIEAPGQVEHRQLPVGGAAEQRRRDLVPEGHLHNARLRDARVLPAFADSGPKGALSGL